MLPLVAAITLKAFLVRANGEVTLVADVHDLKFIELYSVALKLESVKIHYFFFFGGGGGGFYTSGIGSER